MKGHITRGRVDGAWYLRVEMPRRQNGKRLQRRETFRGTKAAAERRLRQLLHDVETGGYAEDERLTMAELCRRWLDSTEHRVATRTFTSYRAMVNLHIIPTLGSLRIGSVRPGHIERAIATWATGPRSDQKRKEHISAHTVAHIYNTLKTIMRWGVRMGTLARNPVESIPPPRFAQREMEVLDPSALSDLLRAAEGSDLHTPIVVAVGTGLRRGELLGLRWSDLDLQEGRLAVRRSVESISGARRIKAPKTRRSARTISLPSFVMEVLRRQRIAQAQRRLLLGLGRDEEGWVFTRADESPWEPGAFSLRFARLVKNSKLPHISFHGLRHSFSTMALASGVDLQTVSRALGHESSAITSRIYAHAVESLQQEAASKINDHLSEAVNGSVERAFKAGQESAVPQWCHSRREHTKKAHSYELSVVAPTGIEPVPTHFDYCRGVPIGVVLCVEHRWTWR
jgi:integrase